MNTTYQSFLLRCWVVPAHSEKEPPTWRFGVRLVEADAKEVYFGEMPALIAFLSTKLNTLVRNLVPSEELSSSLP